MADNHLKSVAQRRFNALEQFYQATQAIEAAKLELTITEALQAGLTAAQKKDTSPHDDH